MGSGNSDTGYGSGGSSSGGYSQTTYGGRPGGNYTGQPPGDYQPSTYGGAPGGDQAGIQFGNNGQMVEYNTTPMYQAMTGQIDRQTQDQVNQLQEQYGDAGMRWSTPLLSQMGATNQRAAEDKNRLLTDLNYKEYQNAYDRARGEQRDIYGRSKDIEQEKYGRYLTGDTNKWNRSRDVEQEKYNRSKSLEQEAYNRWQAGDMDGYNRAMQAAQMELQLTGQENDYNRQLQMDMWGMGGQEEDAANQDLSAYLQQWLYSQNGYMPEIAQLLGGGYNPTMQVDQGIDWGKIAAALGSAYGSSRS